jgi:protein required for attachment to host cells
MSDYSVVSVDGTRARFFTLEAVQLPGVESGPNLVEAKEALINPEVDIPGRELWSDTAAGGMGHTYDDHRDKHIDEFKRRFAKLVAGQAVQFAKRNKAKKLVMVAEKQMLGFIRSELHVSPTEKFELTELAKDLSRLSPLELHSHLASEGLVPPHQNP